MKPVSVCDEAPLTLPGGRAAAPAVIVGRRVLASLLLAGALGGCGFRPIYASRSDGTMGPAEAGLASIEVGLIPERPGQQLREALQERLNRSSAALAPRYDLTVNFSIAPELVAIQQDANATRIRLVGVASWTLTARDPQRSTVTSGVSRNLDGYDIINQQYFGADLSNQAVSARIAVALAEQISLQLAAYFNRVASASSS
jgi:LPS-assembly lipoprotein